MTLRDLLKKREKIRDDASENNAPPQSRDSPPPPEFTFMRTDTNTQELISPPTFAGDDQQTSPLPKTSTEKKRFSRFRSSSNASAKSNTSNVSEKRLSTRLHLGSHSRSSSIGSVNIPSDLPAISDQVGEGEEKEAQWENRATILAQENPVVKQSRSRQGSVGGGTNVGGRPAVRRQISDAKGDVRETIPRVGMKKEGKAG
ncbi:MAG: hypothetical protein Q9168_008234 [Polycauliona sp. 1 TL-2023]